MPKTKDLSRYVGADEAARQLEGIASDLRARGGLVRFYVNLWFHDESAEGQPRPDAQVLSRSLAS